MVLIVVVVVFLQIAVVGPVDASVIGTTRVAATTRSATTGVACTARTGRVAVAVVVVHGDGLAPVVRCADLPTTANGIEALLDAGFAPRVERGFVCGIDGVPATGCATGAGFDGTYWRYFRGGVDGRWYYASIGGGSRLDRHDGCAYEAWVWSGRPDVSPPTVAPAAIDCTHTPVETRPPATTTVPVATTSPPGGSGSTGGAGSPRRHPVQGAAGAVPSSGGSGPGGGRPQWGTPGDVADGRAVAGVDGAVEDPPEDTPSDQTGQAGDRTVGDPGGGPGATVDGDRPRHDADVRVGSVDATGTGEVAVAGTGSVTGASKGAGSPVGTIVAAVIIAVIATGAVMVGRRRTT